MIIANQVMCYDSGFIAWIIINQVVCTPGLKGNIDFGIVNVRL